MYKINRECYRDFVGTINAKRSKIMGELESLSHEENQFEWDCLYQTYCFYTDIQKFFAEEIRWANFDSLESLKDYVLSIENAYKAVDAYNKCVLQLDSDKSVGVTAEEWGELETFRMNLRKKHESWCLFLEFCTTGKL